MKSHVATIELDRTGRALVTQDIVLAVRGGPLQAFELSGIDLDAEPLPDANVSSDGSSKTVLAATPLLVDKRDDGSVRLELDRERGLRTGIYRFHFQYRTNLLARGLIRRAGRSLEVRWVGPRIQEGIDSARAIFRLPAAPTPPVLPSADELSGRVDDADALGGVFIGNLHRLSSEDELEIVRPHVARGEPVVWRLYVDSSAFDGFGAPPPARLEKAALESRATTVGTLARRRVELWLATLAAALGFGLLSWLKRLGFAAACRVRHASARGVLPLPPALNAAAGAVCFGFAIVCAECFVHPTLGALFLSLAMVSAVCLAGQHKNLPRGPGHWLPLSDREAFAPVSERLPGRWLDAGTWPGACSLGLVGLSVAYGCHLLWQRSPYQATMALIGAGVFAPIFLSGRAAQLPVEPGLAARGYLRKLAAELRRLTGIKVVPWARIPEGLHEPDELRLLLQVRGAERGLLGLELGLEQVSTWAGDLAAPYVLMRAREGSALVSALPRQVVWARGRKADERVALLRPRAPTRAQCVELVRELCALLVPKSQASSSKRASVSGKGALTLKPRRSASPLHAS
ncbi:MAG TPA: hypothetical protein VGI10_18425 [Polyangiaceae bacterium]